VRGVRRGPPSTNSQVKKTRAEGLVHELGGSSLGPVITPYTRAPLSIPN